MSDLVPITADPPAATGAAVVVRRHEEAGTRSEAVYSGCERYRYALTRVWNEDAPRIAFVMLNPSTACERRDDPTIARCRRRALASGYGAMRVVNLFALRETRPERMRADAEPVGPPMTRRWPRRGTGRTRWSRPGASMARTGAATRW